MIVPNIIYVIKENSLKQYCIVGVGPPVERNQPEPAFEDSDSDSDAEESGGRVRNDGTLLASDPPKPL